MLKFLNALFMHDFFAILVISDALEKLHEINIISDFLWLIEDGVAVIAMFPVGLCDIVFDIIDCDCHDALLFLKFVQIVGHRFDVEHLCLV